jgi:hypothetical protein
MTTPSETFDALADAAGRSSAVEPLVMFADLGLWAHKNRALISRALKAVETIHDKAMETVNKHHANADDHTVRMAYAYALHEIAEIARPTPPSKDEDHGK